MKLKSVCLIASGMQERNWRLQPWRYLNEVVCQLAALGHYVTVLSDGEGSLTTDEPNRKVSVRRISSVSNPVWKPNRMLLNAIHQAAPEVIIWHLGPTSFLYQAIPDDLKCPIVGLFSSPIYHPRDLARLGPAKLIRNYKYLRVTFLRSLIPNWLLRARAPTNVINSFVVQTKTTRNSIEQAGFWSKPIYVIPPGVDDCWKKFNGQNIAVMKRSWGFNQEDLILLYSGSLVEPRGLYTLLKAFMIECRDLSDLKLVILSRRRTNEWVREDLALRRLLQDNQLEPYVKVISGFLEPAALVSNVAAADIIVLPFELLPSDAPLSISEALALGKPVITTRVACLPELVCNRGGYLAEPGDPNSLSEAIGRAARSLLADTEKSAPNTEKKTARSWQAMGAEWSHLLQSL